MARTTVSRSPMPARARAAVERARTCGCGQALDTCHGRHCPRCGRHVRDGARPSGPEWSP